MKKKFMALLSIALVMVTLVSVPVQAAAQPYAWPGRPKHCRDSCTKLKR